MCPLEGNLWHETDLILRFVTVRFIIKDKQPLREKMLEREKALGF